MFKAMIMNAFPPIDALDDEMQSVESPEKFRTDMLNFMRVIDLHLKTAEVTTTAFSSFSSPGDLKMA